MPHLLQRKHKGNNQVVVQRDDANLTSDDAKNHWDEVASAIQKELETWVEMQCISRRDRHGARNVIDVRWVFKWRHEVVAREATSSTSTAPIQRRSVRARLCLRGFKDMQKDAVASYAGTSQRYCHIVQVS